MNLNRLKIGVVTILMSTSAFWVSCDDQDDKHAAYLKDGETLYIAKPQDLTVRSGDRRVEVSFKLTNVHNVDEAVITYDDQEMVVPIDSAEDTLKKVLIPNLTEGTYVFKAYTRNASGDRSLTSEAVTGIVLGPEYQATLFSRKYQSIDAALGGTMATVNWGAPAEGSIGSRMSYKDADGNLQTVEIANDVTSTVIDSFDPAGGISVVSDYMPANSLDLFTAAEFKAATIPVQLDKTGFTLAELPGDIQRLDPTVPDVEKDWFNIWDGDLNTGKVFLEANNAKPAYVTIDLGVTIRLGLFELEGFGYNPITPKTYQVWGIGDDQDINEVATTTDIHDYADLTEEEMADPAKVAEKRAANFQAWQDEAIAKGWKLLIDDSRSDGAEASGFSKEIRDETSVRYVRLVFIDNFSGGGNPDIGMDEITFTGLVEVED